MASSHRAPKQWCLTTNETINSFENWRQNLVYTLTLDTNFTKFLEDEFSWKKKSRKDAFRGMVDDGESIPESERRTKQQILKSLELMLGQIANFCPVIARNEIVNKSTSLNNIWQQIRLHFGFQSSGAHFLDLADIMLQPDEKPEDLYQRIVAFIEDNLLQKDSNITHHDERIEEDEEITPSMENMIVLLWLQTLHKDLPKIVKQRYATELRCRTLASIKTEISQALPSLLEETLDPHARVMKTDTSRRGYEFPRNKLQTKSFHAKRCPICQANKRPDNHFLSKCTYLPNADKKYMARARAIIDVVDTLSDVDTSEEDEEETTSIATTRHIQVTQSPYINTFYLHHKVKITIDTGATGNMIKAALAERLNLKITKSEQSATQADGMSPLDVVGETRFYLVHGDHKLEFEGLVVENLDVDVLGGTPFMERNDIMVRPAKKQIIVQDNTIIYYGSKNKNKHHIIRRTHVVRAPPHNLTIWPGDFLEINVPDDVSDKEIAVEPRVNGQSDPVWPMPIILPCVANRVRIPNLTETPQRVARNSHFCQLVAMGKPLPAAENLATPKIFTKTAPYSSDVSVDPDDILQPAIKTLFKETLLEYDEVFNPKFKGYNKAAGPFEAVVNMGPTLPPQRKGRVPQYNRNKLSDLQDKFDQLEDLGVFKKPEDIGISVEYINPSFLINKPSGGHRLVTAFADVGRYSKPQPGLMPDVDSILRQIGQWKYLIATDLSNAFYQIPLARDSMKYCGVVTPFKGCRVYARCAMGMPGSEVALEELMTRILGHLIQDGIVIKLADDLFCGADTPEQLLSNWKRVLSALHKCNMSLSAKKTTIAPRSTIILGWKWQEGTLQATSHRISTLATCKRPQNVKEMRSFIGAYKVLSRVIKNAASYLSNLDKLTGGNSSDMISWSEELEADFKAAQQALLSHKTIHLPRSEDQIWIITDGSVKQQGIGATMYISREGDSQLKLAGFFSAKLKDRQVHWLPCEIEALAICIATKHFSPFLIQSAQNACILTDSKPCVQSYEKLCRGEFSSSPRVSTFLSIVSRYQASVRHIAGIANLPSDHASRNTSACCEGQCQICMFINKTEESVVRKVTFSDIIEGTVKLPFTNRKAWLSIQSDSADLRRTHAHLKQGTRPSKKVSNAKNIKRYLQVASIAQDGLVVVKKQDPLCKTRELIIVPQEVLDGVLCAIHIQLEHPSENQMRMVTSRYLYALDMNKAIQNTTRRCHVCASLCNTPKMKISQSTSSPPESVGATYAADVLRRERQKILLIRETVSSFTVTALIENEQKDQLRDTMIKLMYGMCPLEGPPVVVRCDGASGFTALQDDKELLKYGITVEVGRIKNSNKNPVAEKAIRELEDELIRLSPQGGIISSKVLAVATATLNTRVRARGFSSREMWLQRDQFSNDQILFKDRELIMKQHNNRVENHATSEKSKAPMKKPLPECGANVGDIVYLYSDRTKHHSRDRYLVTDRDSHWLTVKKITGPQFRSTSYKVKDSECFKVSDISICSESDEDEYEYNSTPAVINSPPAQPDIPPEISRPIDAEYQGTHANDIEDSDNERDDREPHVSNADESSGKTVSGDVNSEYGEGDISDTIQRIGDDDVRPKDRPQRVRKAPKWHNDYVMQF